ncbi:MAG: tripartite tricarboxylate transporter substrate binding protein [Rubrivivax sp.]|nr:tripartite tricarboxylate transporter substrate binding protein [Rubrivivax sp.]
MNAARRTLFACLLAALVAPAAPALAQEWPAKPIRLIIPYPPGGQTDIVGRWLGTRLSAALGQQVVMDNRAGAQGIVGMSAAKAAEPDGYTLVYSNVSISLINRFAHAKLPYDALTDFEPVSLIGYTTLGLAVPQASGLKTLDELVRHVKANPGKSTFASFGIGSTAHIYGEMFNGAAGLDMAHVPYKGTAPATLDVVAGRATAGYIDFSSMGAMIQAGKLTVLAVTGTQRWPQYPNVPTFGELGFPLDLPGWAGIMAPKGTPRPVIDRLSQEIAKILRTPEGQADMLEKGGIIAVGSTPGEFAERLRRDAPRWGEAFAKSGVKPQE